MKLKVELPSDFADEAREWAAQVTSLAVVALGVAVFAAVFSALVALGSRHAN